MAINIKYVTHKHSLLRGGLQLCLPLVSPIFAALQLFLQGHYGGVHPLPLVLYLALGLTGDGPRHGRNAQNFRHNGRHTQIYQITTILKETQRSVFFSAFVCLQSLKEITNA